jgi:hypothetical protein
MPHILLTLNCSELGNKGSVENRSIIISSVQYCLFLLVKHKANRATVHCKFVLHTVQEHGPSVSQVDYVFLQSLELTPAVSRHNYNGDLAFLFFCLLLSRGRQIDALPILATGGGGGGGGGRSTTKKNGLLYSFLDHVQYNMTL